MSDLIGIPNGAERFHVKGKGNFVVYNVQDAVGELSEPLYIAYRVHGSDERERLTNSADGWDDVAISDKEWKNMGVVEVGYSEELTDQLPDHPWRQFEKNLEQEAELRPWLKDDEFLELASQAYLEGRDVSEAEMKSTEWWQNTTATQREWMEFVNSNGEDAINERVRELSRNIVHQFEQRGWQVDERNPPTGIADYYAKKLLRGEMTEPELEDRIRHETDPYTRGASPFAGHYLKDNEEIVEYAGQRYLRDPGGNYWKVGGPGQTARYNQEGIQSYDEELDVEPSGMILDYFEQRDQGPEHTGLGNVENVRREFRRWLGPNAKGISEDVIGDWAHRIRRNENAKDELTEHLSKQRMALYPEYENPHLTWEDISEPWKGVYQQFAGHMPQDTDGTLNKIVRTNDYTEAQKILRREGLNKGWEPVLTDFMQGANQALGDTHRPSAQRGTRRARL